jgi:hypothetical protein
MPLPAKALSFHLDQKKEAPIKDNAHIYRQDFFLSASKAGTDELWLFIKKCPQILNMGRQLTRFWWQRLALSLKCNGMDSIEPDNR